MTTSRPKLVCQYWSPDEPVQCSHWDNDNTYCLFEEEVTQSDGSVTIKRAPYYPLCNYIGTEKFRCNKYDGSGTKGRCVIPDRTRATPHSENCSWTDIVGTVDTSNGGEIVTPIINYDKINEYNNGQCKSGGTPGIAPECRGYSPQHMGFGRRAVLCPDAVKTTYEPDNPDGSKTADIPFNTELPAAYNVLNLRAKLGKCWWWQEEDEIPADVGKFTVDEDGIVVGPIFKCKNENTGTVNRYKDFYIDETLEAFMPPCNGAKPDCPLYTGNMIAPNNSYTYLSDRYLRSGDKILAEQILELRYNVKKFNWTPELYSESFTDPIIYTFTGKSPKVNIGADGSLLDYEIASYKVYIPEDGFDCFTIKKDITTLTQGNPTENCKVNFPTLIRKLENISPQPIIMTSFENDLYETSNPDHKKLFISGSVIGTNTGMVAINISDPEISFRFSDIISHNSMSEIKNSRIARGHLDLYNELIQSLDCYFEFLFRYSKHKLFSNEFLKDNMAFGMGVDTFFGENEIIVFNQNNNWEFNKIKIKKVFCGGIVAQTSFKVEADGFASTQYFDFSGGQEASLTNMSPEIKFEYKPFNIRQAGITSVLNNYYIDTYIKSLDPTPLSPSDNNYYEVGYKFYNVLAFVQDDLDSCEIKILSNDGTILVDISDEGNLHYIIKPWEIDGDLKLTGKNVEGIEYTIDMKIDKYCTDDLESNQMIIKPKNLSDYRRLYEIKLQVPHIYTFERYSFGQYPSLPYEEIELGSETEIYTVKYGSLDITEGEATLTDVPDMPIVISAVFKGSTSGRLKGQMKTDLIVWTKQVHCADVEIFYNWESSYTAITWIPEHKLYAENISTRDDGTATFTYAPHCGDHYYSWLSGETRKPMWYPYDACKYPASYEINLPTGETDIWIMEIFERESYPTEQIRMLGPADRLGKVTDEHTHIWACTSDWTYTNYIKQSNSWFVGYAKLRGNITYEEMDKITNNSGLPPMFGNPVRDTYRSLRSSACLFFKVITSDGGIYRSKRWLPKYESFSLTTLDKSFLSYPYKHYFNTNDIMCTYLDSFGNFLVDGLIDNFNVDETLVGEEVLERYAFNDVFRTHSSSSVSIEYPKPIKQYNLGNEPPKPISNWYTYKQGPQEGKTIQWAWRETWKDLERPDLDVSSALFTLKYDLCSIEDLWNDNLGFLSLFYPNYTFDYKVTEKRRVCEEGLHTLHLKPCIKKEGVDWYFFISFELGVPILLDHTLQIVTDYTLVPEDLEFEGLDHEFIIAYVKFYGWVTGPKWLNSVNAETDLDDIDNDVNTDLLQEFLLTYSATSTPTEEAAENLAELEERVVQYYDSDGTEVIKYYLEGLIVRIYESTIGFLPKEYSVIEDPYEFKMSRPSDDNTQFSLADPDEWYPANLFFGTVFDASNGPELDLTFKFDTGVIIGKVEFIFECGVKYGEVDPISGLSPIEMLYHKPEITLTSYKKDLTEVYTTDKYNFKYYASDSGSGLITVTEIISIDLSLEDTNIELYYLKLNMRLKPDVEEITIEDDGNLNHGMRLMSVKLSEVYYIEVTEKIETFERKFNISLGNYSDFPVHGFDDTGSMLYADPFIQSTVYQIDDSSGTLGVAGTDTAYSSIGKLRGRHVGDIIKDKTPIREDLPALEKKQKDIYDNMVHKGSDNIIFNSVVHTLLKDTAEKVGITNLPVWTCTLNNTALRPLEPVKSYNKLTPDGHVWFPDPETFEPNTWCGFDVVTYFRYGWSRVAGGITFKSLDAFEVYTLEAFDDQSLLEAKLDVMTTGGYLQ